MTSSTAWRAGRNGGRSAPAWLEPLLLSMLLLSGLAPTASAIDLPGRTSATFTWASASGPVAGYNVYVSRDGYAFPPVPEQKVSGTTATVLGSPNETVSVRVQAYDAAGRTGEMSASSEGVRFTVAASPTPVLAVAPLTHTLEVQQGATPPNRSFTIQNAGGGTLSWRATPNVSWIVSSAGSGTTRTETDTVTLSFQTQGLAPGIYVGGVAIVDTVTQAQRTVGVLLTVTGAAPSILLDTGSVSVTAAVGQNAPDRTFQIRNGGGGTLAYTLTDSAGWLRISPPTGTSTGESDPVRLIFDTSGLTAGTWHATVAVTASGATNSPRTLSVTVTVQNAPVIQASTDSLSAVARHRLPPASQSFTVANAGAGRLDWQVASDATWLVPSPASGSSYGEADPVSVSFDTAGLAPGHYSGSLRVTAPGATPRTVPVSLRVRAPNADLDGDGISEGLLWARSNGRILVWSDLLGSPLPGGFLFGGLPDDWQLLFDGDYDGDGRSDMAWHGRATGAIGLCLLEGSVPRVCASPIQVGAARVSLGSGDFDGDGRSDLVWRNAATGVVEACLMDGVEIRTCVALGAFPPAWRVVATGDYDGDGRTDLAAQDPASGRMDLCITAPGPAPGPCTTPYYVVGSRIVGAGDYDGDGRADLLWSSADSTRLMLSFPSSPNVPAFRMLGTVTAGAEIVASSDLDGNGRAEVLLRDPATGDVTVLVVGAFGLERRVPLGPLGLDFTLAGSDPVQ